MSIKYGCQTYTWQMNLEKHKNELASILQVIEQADFSGVEAEVCMMGHFYRSPELFREALDQRHLKLAALTLALPWKNKEETEKEKQEAELLFQYLSHFPEAKLILVHLPGTDRSELKVRQQHGLMCANAVARRSHELGIIAAFHPNSHHGSVFRTQEDYDVMFEGLDTKYLGYCPDSGHIANGDMDVLKIFQDSRHIIQHVHFKDISSEKQWKAMGEGVIDHHGLVRLLESSNYDGWVMVEEESKEAEIRPNEVTIHNGRYVNEHF